MLKEVRLDISYEKYMRPALIWATESSEDLAEALDVIKVAAKGSYVRGILGGERRSGVEQYAGLVVSYLEPVDNGFYFRLHNTHREYLVPSDMIEKYGIDIYRIYYMGRINPFKCSTLDVILSSIGGDELREFIRELIKINEDVMTRTDERRLKKLAEELQAQMKPLRDSHYVVYRGSRIFSACVPEDLNKAIADSSISYLECKSAEQAHYYAAVLNYMAYKIINKKREFVRGQWTKPLIALTAAGLTWRDLPPQLRDEIAMLSQALSKKLTWIRYSNQREAILETAKRPEFNDIIKLLDRHIEKTGKQEMLEEALYFVSSSARRRVK